MAIFEVHDMTMRRFSLSVIIAAVGLAGLVPAAQAEVRVSPNYKLDSDPNPYRGRDQTALAVNPANPQHVVTVNANYLDLVCEASRSLDGGLTWSTAVPLALPSPAAGQAPFARSCRTYQSVEFGSGQNVYTTSTAARTTNSITDSSTIVYKSTDGGASWQTGVVAIEGGPGSATNPTPGPSLFNPSLSVHPGAGGLGRDRVYVTASQSTQQTFGIPACALPSCSDARVVVSNDGGDSFSAGSNANPPGTATRITDAPSKPVVNLSDGSVTLLYRTQGSTALLHSVRSVDGGQTWSAPVDVVSVTNTGTSTQTHILNSGAVSASASYPRVARDPANGWIHLVYSQGSTGPTAPAGGFQGTDHFISPDSAVYYQRSKDRGATWSTPKLISDRTQYPGTPVVQTRHPTVSVSPNGRVNVVWHDRRHWYGGPGERQCTHSHSFCEDLRLGDTYLAYSENGGDSFSSNIRVSDRSNNDEVGYDTRPSGYWSWGPQAVTVGGDQLLVGWMDSREGNWDTDTEDTYLAKVNFNASGAVPTTHVDAPDVVSRSVALSRRGYRGGNEGAMTGGVRDPAGPGGFGPATRNASSVVIVNETDVAGALAGQVLGRANPAPVLLSPAGGLTAAVKAEISRLRPYGAFVIGDAAQLSPQVMADVAAAMTAAGVPSPTVTRLSGANDAATAAAVAAAFDRRLPVELTADSPAYDAAIIANPASPDAAAAAGLAAARRLPFLYVSANAIPAETSAALTSLDINKTLVIGGTDAVSSGVLSALPAATNPTRLGGADQYATSKAVVAESKARGLPGNVVYVADGTKPIDAALQGGVAGRETGILMLAPAPLYSTAAAQAADNGLTGISSFSIAGPAAPGPVPPPPPPPVAPPPVAPPPVAPPPVAPPPVAPPAAEAGPVLSRVSLARRAFKARLGTTIRLTLSKDARLSIAVAQRVAGRRIGSRCVALTPVTRKRRPCVRFQTRGTVTSNRKKGANRVRFVARVGGRLLKPGTYRLTLRARDSGGRLSRPVSVTARVVR